MASTDQFLACAKKLENHITPSERRLYFRTASAHMASGCPLLALDVLSRFPRQISSATLQPIDSAVPAVEDSLFDVCFFIFFVFLKRRFCENDYWLAVIGKMK